MRRVAILATSLGGYYAPRCAAMDSRYAACIAWGPIWDYHATWARRIQALQQAALPVPAEHLLWATSTKSYDEALKKLEGFKSGNIAHQVTVPFLLLHGAEDAQVSTADAEKLFAAIASKDKTLRVFTAAEGGAQHCQRDYLSLGCDVVADWLEDRLKK
jgi:dipeptidyl aminopeptidase/acylaminoacyl peptidase